MNNFNQQVPQGPQDYQNFFHTNEEGNIYLDGEGKPISLQKTLTGHTQVISPTELWHSTQTRHGTHPQLQPKPNKAINSTAIDPNTNQPIEIPTGVSPIKGGEETPNDLEIQKKNMIEMAFKTIMENTPKENWSGMMDNFANVLDKLSQGTLEIPNSNEETEAKLREAEQINKTLEHQNSVLNQEIKTKVAETEQNYKTQLANYHKELQAKQEQLERFQQNLAAQVSEKVGKQQAEWKIKLQNLEQQKQIEAQNLRAAYQNQLQDLENQKLRDNQTLQAEITKLQQQLHHRHITQPPPIPNYTNFDTTLNQSVLNELSTSITIQTQIAKQQLLLQAKAYDGKDPKELYTWLDEISRLSSQNGYTQIEVATQTSRGSVHRYVTDLAKQNLGWDRIKTLLRERYSDCSSSAAAQNKLALLKQNSRPMHEYISHFTDLLEHAHNMKPSDLPTKLLANQFIEGIDEENKYIRNKLREKSGTNLEWYFKEAMQLQHKQEIRAIDFKRETETKVNQIGQATTDINAIRNNSLTCHRCNSPDHFIKDCPLNNPSNNHNPSGNYKPNPKPPHDSQLDRLIDAIHKLINKDQQQSNNRQVSYAGNNRQSSYQGNNRQGNYQSNNSDNRHANYQSNNRESSNNGDNRHANYQSKAPNNRPRQYNRYNDNKGGPHRQTAGTNAIEEYNPSDAELDNYQDEGTEYYSDTCDTETKN